MVSKITFVVFIFFFLVACIDKTNVNPHPRIQHDMLAGDISNLKIYCVALVDKYEGPAFFELWFMNDGRWISGRCVTQIGERIGYDMLLYQVDKNLPSRLDLSTQ